tara:strand:+ start:45 stop:281 length:237 start_codon:yes stop_codon:yes gene_type:complete
MPKKKKEKIRTIKIKEKDFQEFIKLTNKLDWMLTTINEVQDIYMSDIKALSDLRWRIQQSFNLTFNSNTYRYEEEENV